MWFWLKGISSSTWILAVIFLMILVWLIYLVFTIPESEIQSGCAKYTTQAQAQQAMQDGIKRLDNDHDGIACENLP